MEQFGIWTSYYDDGETDQFIYMASTPYEQLLPPSTNETILKEGEAENKKKVNIKPHHVKHLFGVMMAQMLQGDASIKIPTMHQPLIVCLQIVYQI